ncbi:acyltransferase family protein [Microbacterium hydrocarbonoxydans]|uniref:acyltransferase family protein n=1 Tax=Microbacterium hydrocarbonoxydans TaxID=273678 RepID=UPI00203DC9A4|nr:acyltransferase family protein [Microbacterium hydrocarbonoxydans]MCM3778114.1 acyltransferase family protein [Microbacterium hydrocarbonoxydans]
MNAQAKPRIDWVDAGRGSAIALVVLFHSTNWLGEAGFGVAGWEFFDETIASIRLPLFFTMSGLFAVKWMRASWADLWRSKVSLFVWVFAVWSVIATFSFMLGLNVQGAEGNYLGQLKNLLWAPFLPRFELWFIWALALFFVVAKLMTRLPLAIQLSLTGVLSIVALSDAFVGNAGVTGSAKYFFFFLCGILLRDRIIRWSNSSGPIPLTAVFALWVALALGGTALGLRAFPGYYFVCCVVGVFAGVAVSRMLARIPGPRYLGTRTLPVYLTHTTIILVVVWILARTLPMPELALLGAVLPPILAAVAIAASLGLSRLVSRDRVLRYMYVQPAWFARRPSDAESTARH